jgi:hypothetical protein
MKTRIFEGEMDCMSKTFVVFLDSSSLLLLLHGSGESHFLASNIITSPSTFLALHLIYQMEDIYT